MMSESEYYVRWRGEVSGPFSVSKLHDMLRRGDICEWHEVSESKDEWKQLVEEGAIIDALVSADQRREERSATGDTSGARAPDPSSGPMGEWYYSIEGQIEGPCAGRELVGMFKNGLLDREDLVCPVDDPDGWEEIADTPEFLAAVGEQGGAGRKGRDGELCDPEGVPHVDGNYRESEVPMAEPYQPEDRSPSPNYFLVVVSFLIPLIGFIVGAIYAGKDSQQAQATGRACLIAAIIGLIAGFIGTFIFLLVGTELFSGAVSMVVWPNFPQT